MTSLINLLSQNTIICDTIVSGNTTLITCLQEVIEYVECPQKPVFQEPQQPVRPDPDSDICNMTQFTAYPNPVPYGGDRLNIAFDELFTGSIEMRHMITGRSLPVERVYGYSHSIDVSQALPGTYLFMLIGDKGCFRTTRVMIYDGR